jgi:hypothetical protein
MSQQRSPICDWCKEPIGPDELEVGEVTIEKDVRRERIRSTGLFSEERQWEEEEHETITERRPFHRDCLRQYQGQGTGTGCTFVLAGIAVALVYAFVFLFLLA